MKNTLLLSFILVLIGPSLVRAQGCVAIRGNAACGGITMKLLRISEVKLGQAIFYLAAVATTTKNS